MTFFPRTRSKTCTPKYFRIALANVGLYFVRVGWNILGETISDLKFEETRQNIYLHTEMHRKTSSPMVFPMVFLSQIFTNHVPISISVDLSMVHGVHIVSWFCWSVFKGYEDEGLTTRNVTRITYSDEPLDASDTDYEFLNHDGSRCWFSEKNKNRPKIASRKIWTLYVT